MKKIYSQRVRQRASYVHSDGSKLPGATTAIREWDKSYALVPWANKLGLAGINSSKYTDEKGMIGTLVHAFVNGHLKGIPTDQIDTNDFSKNEIDEASNAFLKFLEWEKQHQFEPILVEKPLVSDFWRYGGTPDFYGKIDGLLTLADWKSGGIWREHWIQLAAYGILLEEHGYRVEQRILLNIGRDETENFIESKRSGPSLEDEKLIFLSCLAIYEAKKRLKQE